MKKLIKEISVILCIAMLMSFLPQMSFAQCAGTVYYVDSLEGSDQNCGTEPQSAFATAEKLREISLEPGDKILFKSGGIYECNNLKICAAGSKDNPIVISSYSQGEKPLLFTNNNTEVLSVIDSSFIEISNLEITAPNGGGIWIDTLQNSSTDITLKDLTIHNIQNTKAVSRDNLSSGAASARACVMVKGLPANSRYPVDNLTVTGCELYDCGNGISVWGSWNDEQKPWCDEEDIDPVFNKGLYISNCSFHDMDAEALIIGICDGARCVNCSCIDCCQNTGIVEGGNSFFTAAMWFWGSVNSSISHCEISGQKNEGDGMTCDFDSYSHYCTYEYIYSHDNVRFVNNCPQHSGHKGNTIRYCLSVNDNKAKNNLSQYCYDSNEYGIKFYNNTLVNSQEFIIEGVRDGYIANNIFYGDLNFTFRSTRKKTNDETGEKFYDEFTGVMTNNCFFGTCIPSCSKNSIIANPSFTGSDFANPLSFRLSEKSTLLGKGVYIDGEDFEGTDIFSNPINSKENVNIGCYAGAGEKEYEKESVIFVISKYVLTFLGKIVQWITDCNNKYWLF